MPGSGRQLSSSPGTAERQKASARSFRLRRPPGHNSQQGDIVIRALVRARLLGMQLLTLEARVVVGTDDGNWPGTSYLFFHLITRPGGTLDHQGLNSRPPDPGRCMRARSSCWSRARTRLSAVGDPAETQRPWSYDPEPAWIRPAAVPPAPAPAPPARQPRVPTSPAPAASPPGAHRGTARQKACHTFLGTAARPRRHQEIH